MHIPRARGKIEKDVLFGHISRVFLSKNTGGKIKKDIILDAYPFRSYLPRDIHTFSVFGSGFSFYFQVALILYALFITLSVATLVAEVLINNSKK